MASEGKHVAGAQDAASKSKEPDQVGELDLRAPCREEAAGCFSTLVFGFLDELLGVGATRQLTLQDLGRPHPKDLAAHVHNRWARLYEPLRAANVKPGLMLVVKSAGISVVLLSAVFAAAKMGLLLLQPKVFQWLIISLADPTAEHVEKWTYAVLLLVLPITRALMNSFEDKLMARVSQHVSTALITAIYRKSLKIQLAASGKNSGEVVNLMSHDTGLTLNFLRQVNDLWVAPVTVAIGLWMLEGVVGDAAFWGLLILAATGPLNVFIISKLYKFYKQKSTMMDKRVKVINEVISGIRIIKTYAWEGPFLQKIDVWRKKELGALLKFLLYIALGFRLILASTITVMNLVVFIVYTSDSANVLDTATAFTALQLFEVVRGPFLSLPSLLVAWLQSKVAFGRIADYLVTEELTQPADPYERTDAASCKPGDPAVRVRAATFAWPDAVEDPSTAAETAKAKAKADKAQAKADNKAAKAKGKGKGKGKDKGQGGAGAAAAAGAGDAKESEADADPFELQLDNFTVHHGELLAIVGRVGSGKSSLLAALLGEIQRSKGDLEVHGTISYAAQQPWIQNATVRRNILFAADYDAAWYAKVVAACALEADFKVLPGGDQCEIGEKGINLSGGQKARVALARAVYANKEICMFDDPLSAVDAHVGKHLFNECLCGILAGKTRVLVTNQLQFLPNVDRIVVLDKGRVMEVGTFHELLVKGGFFASLMEQLGVTEEDQADAGGDGTALPPGPVRASSSGSAAGSGRVRTVSSAASRRRKKTRGLSISGDAPSASVLRLREEEAGAVRAARSASTASAVSEVELGSAAAISPKADGGASRERSKSALAADAGQLTHEEERDSGLVGWGPYKYYLQSVSACAGATVLMAMVVTQVLMVGNTFWIGSWTQVNAGTGGMSSSDVDTFLLGFGLISAGLVLSLFLQSVASAYAQYRASVTLHDNLMMSIVRAPISFFDVTPSGRILNRITKDVSAIDNAVGQLLMYFLFAAFGLVGALGGILIATKGLFAVVMVPVLWVYLKIQVFLRRSMIEVQRLSSVTRSPVFTSFAETLNGLATIRGYGMQRRFIDHNAAAIDKSNLPQLTQRFMAMWLSVRLEVLGAVSAFAVAALAIGSDGSILPVGFVAVALQYAMTLTGTLQGVVLAASSAEAQMNSVERVMEYTEDIPSEAAEERDDDPPAEWPTRARVKFNDLAVRYRDGPQVLRGVTAEVMDKEKIGVVGRTGAGKSSLMVALFRIVEADGGNIEVDGVDISKVGLRTLRSRLGIIPQDAVIFSGTVRYNLDPFGDHDDKRLWEALERAQLKDAIKSLDDEVAEGGDNFSVGQRQLMCLARAFLRNPKVLVMDEATANVDVATDAAIQRMIRECFKDSCVLTIAHRLETIADSSRVLVLDKGTVAEYDTPAHLLEQPTGIFKGMVEATGAHNAERLAAIARGELEVAAFVAEGGTSASGGTSGAGAEGGAAGTTAGATIFDRDLEELPVTFAHAPFGLVLARTPTDEGVVVASVGTAAPAELVDAGVQSGDALLTIAGFPADTSPLGAVQAMVEAGEKEVAAGGTCALVFGRPLPTGLRADDVTVSA